MALVRATRPEEQGTSEYIKKCVAWGAGPRAGQGIILASKARAALDGRSCVTVEDIQSTAIPVLRHRLLTTYAAQAEGQTPDRVVAHLLEEIPIHQSAERIDGQVAQLLRS